MYFHFVHIFNFFTIFIRIFTEKIYNLQKFSGRSICSKYVDWLAKNDPEKPQMPTALFLTKDASHLPNTISITGNYSITAATTFIGSTITFTT